MTIRQAVASGLAVAYLCAPPGAAQDRNPYEGDELAIRTGGSVFAGRCADCHGADAKGARGPDLTALWARGVEDARVFATIRTGVEGSIMPPSAAPDAEIWAVVAYLRSISTVAPFANERGDAERGRELFAMHCSGCHRVDGAGGSLGPDLTRIGAVRSRESLAQSIREPSAEIAAGYRPVMLTTRAGATIHGLVKSEDAFSIQIVDTDERLQGYRKAELAALERDTESLMPDLSPGELGRRRLDDVLAYLGTLRGRGTGGN